MGYVEQNLMPDEHVVLKAALHWAIFVGPATVAALGFFLLLASYASRDYLGAGITYIAWMILLMAVLAAAQSGVSYLTTEFAVTNKRVIGKRGLLRRHSLELLLSKVESIGVNQPIMGRIFNYGTIVVVGTGGTKEAFPNIVGPMEFRKRINAQIAAIA